MELDDLKGAWKQHTQQTEKKLLSDEALHALLRSKATNAIDLLKRSIRFELWFTILFIMICIVVGFVTAEQATRNISFITSILSCGFVFYYYKKLMLLDNLAVENKPIKETLTKLVTQFEKFLWFYRWGYNILIPIALLVGAFVGIQAATGKDFIEIVLEVKLWATVIVILVPIAVIFNFGIKLYLKKLYGNHLAHLRSILLELEQ